ncbi:hypothetical protein GON01_10215 [Sphingomonas sp. MAH-20]|uniref:Uncharacterized protein n=1 Tax=Sphingomonas horti TaxID=2682842 RepID=A0A6I4J1L6_9SPHN|nr:MULTISPECIES: hypothetical protein [Sphingomonas]MBA2919425.1 hypothetical protein [Sphingomonas sp. CGMCC 1.13658]MVO78305.1 hypothetical protein [Sphingomonas horti]
MATDNQTNATNQSQGGTTMADRASDLKERAGTLFQGGVDAVKNNPGTTAAVIGGVAAAAAAVMNKDKIVEAAGAMRDKMSSGRSEKSSDKG